MELSQGIRKVGFSRWYERELIESHLYLMSWFLSLVLVLACLEGFSFKAPGWEPVVRFAGMTAGVVLCMWTLQRYIAMLAYALHAAERSVCRNCRAYSAFELRERKGYAAASHRGAVDVRCVKCGHEWTIE